MKSACVGVLSIIELKNARWNIEIQFTNNFSSYIFHIWQKCSQIFVVKDRNMMKYM